MRATIDGPATGSTAEMGAGRDAINCCPPMTTRRHAGRDPTTPTSARFWDFSHARRDRARLVTRRPAPAPSQRWQRTRSNPIQQAAPFQFLSFSVSENS